MGATYTYARVRSISASVLDFSASGDNTIISGSSGGRIAVYGLWLVSAGATSLTFKDGSSTSFSGVVNLAANQEIHLPLRGEPWFVTSSGNDFIINSLNAVQVGGIIDYLTSGVAIVGYSAIILIDANLVRWAVTVLSSNNLNTTVTPTGPTLALEVDPIILQSSGGFLYQLGIEITGNLTTTLVGSAASPYTNIQVSGKTLTVSDAGNLITT